MLLGGTMLKKLKKWFAERVVKLIIKKYFKLWGVKIELPSVIQEEFIITNHAYKRIMDRVGCNEEKIKKLAIKAWYSTNKVDMDVVRRKNYKYEQVYGERQNNVHYRSLMGYTYIWEVKFVSGYAQKKLITVY